MAILEINRFAEMQTFVTVVELNSFSATAKRLNKSPSAISKLISRLEARLNTRLFNRSTRGLQLTEEGDIFYQQSIQVLAKLEAAEHAIINPNLPSGHLRVTTSLPIGKQFLLPLIEKFTHTYPNISLDINLIDRVINLIEEQTDVAIRSGPLKNSTLIARNLGKTSLLVIGAPKSSTTGIAGSLRKPPLRGLRVPSIYFNY